MGKVFELPISKGSLRERYSNTILTNTNCEFKRTEKGKCISTNGSTSFLNADSLVSNVASLSKGSIEVWFKYSIEAINRTLFSSSDKSDASSDMSIINISGSGLSFFVRENGANIIDARLTTAYGDGIFHQYIITVDSSGNKHFIDGVQVTPSYNSGSSSTQAFFSSVNDLDTLGIGNRGDSGGNETFWNGYISSVMIYDKALSQAEIVKSYQQFLIASNIEPPVRGFINPDGTEADVYLYEKFQGEGAD